LRCLKCFKDKDSHVDLRDATGCQDANREVNICKGCFYELDTLIGFLDYHGLEIKAKAPTRSSYEPLDEDGQVE